MVDCPDAVFAFRGEDELPYVYLFFGAMMRRMFQDPDSGEAHTDYKDRNGDSQPADTYAVPYGTFWPHLDEKLGPGPVDCYLKPAGKVQVHGLTKTATGFTKVSWHPQRNIEPECENGVLQQPELATVSGMCETEHPDHVLLFGTSGGKPVYWVWNLNDPDVIHAPVALPQGQGQVQAAFLGYDRPKNSKIPITRLYSRTDGGFTETAYTITTTAKGHQFVQQPGAARFLSAGGS
ncbi:hypothetical protein FAF44_37575 [Nonomuraea sp. MG754425]|uniref:hypothetical protein n=1 Tax=Nonomuraea sp. MG754425 TaxID=2570319 RepID=UPI001F2B88F4|nr:hypothetical protein [Nonomuraea sp. MG754425]MCF6474054.1 hypothetical protein [Nonomuraea sp. MG754425]